MSATHRAYIATSNTTAFSARTALPAASVTAGSYLWHAPAGNGGIGAAVLDLVTSTDVISSTGIVNPLTLRGEH